MNSYFNEKTVYAYSTMILLSDKRTNGYTVYYTKGIISVVLKRKFIYKYLMRKNSNKYITLKKLTNN